MLEFNERTRCAITLTFTDEAGAPVIPASFTWRVDDPNTDAEIAAAATVVPTSATHQLTISTIINTCSGTHDELRRVTVEAVGLVASEYLYKVHKLKGAL